MDDKDNRETICKADRKCFPIFAFCKTKFSKDIRGNDLASRAVVVPQKKKLCFSKQKSTCGKSAQHIARRLHTETTPKRS